MTLAPKIEAILFIVAKPLSIGKLAEFLKADKKDVEAAVAEIQNRLDTKESGMRLVRSGSEVQMMTSPDYTKLVRDFVKDEVTGELTKPQLETLTVIAYRQPITKPELEQIRGINCSLILRNLMMRGLIEVEESSGLGATYRVSHEFLKFLGIDDVQKLPDYEKLHHDERLQVLLSGKKSTEENPGHFNDVSADSGSVSDKQGAETVSEDEGV